MNTVRTNITFPKDLLLEVDKLVGEGKRSAFLAESVREYIARSKFSKIIKESAGILNVKDYPRFASTEKVRTYIRAYRKKNSIRLK